MSTSTLIKGKEGPQPIPKKVVLKGPDAMEAWIKEQGGPPDAKDLPPRMSGGKAKVLVPQSIAQKGTKAITEFLKDPSAYAKKEADTAKKTEDRAKKKDGDK